MARSKNIYLENCSSETGPFSFLNDASFIGVTKHQNKFILAAYVTCKPLPFERIESWLLFPGGNSISKSMSVQCSYGS